MTGMQYQPASIEPKWQKIWEEKKAFRTPSELAVLKTRPKFYVLDMFPYPSGAGLHAGHPEGYTATDVVARMKRMQGHWVLHPMGWDAFGLPAERAAMRDNIHPAIITKRNIDNFRRQIKRLGFSYDWDREFSTTDADYYRWTQWIFLKLYEKGLAYMAEVPVNWCPALGTVLSNEEVKDGVYVETGDPVERRLMKQWMLKITAYAERLEKDLDQLDWPEGVKQMQREWIGKSVGAEIKFEIDGSSEHFSVFTTRPDTLFGVTYCVLAPEHPLVSVITKEDHKKTVAAFVHEMQQTPDLQRTDLAKDKRGVFTGAFAKHPITGKRLPVWIANFVLASYGTGAVMSVPAHDERDHEFAKKYQLPLQRVIEGGTVVVEEAAFTGDGPAVASEFINGLVGDEARRKVTEYLEQEGKGKSRTTYRLRDWLFSRQRYWGEPFPIVHLADGTVVPLPDDTLPIQLPVVDEYKPTEDGHPPLARAKEWLDLKLPDGRMGRRETNTMPQWAGSCWYYLRYLDPKNSQQAWSPELEKYWMPVDLYIGGVEHAVLHLLYARFWHKVLYDAGYVSTPEPFQKLFNQGMILGISYRDKRGKYYAYDDVETKDGKSVLKQSGEELESQIEKMSKSKLNVVSPDEVIDRHGADAMRLYELFLGPLDQTKPWKMEGVEGVYRFLSRAWRLVVDDKTGALSARLTEQPGSSEMALWRNLHKTIKKVTEDTQSLAFNTAIAQMMIFTNEATHAATLPKETLLAFVRVLSAYAPHLAEELWERLGQKDLVSLSSWPAYDPALVVDDEITLVVQVNGKLRDKLQVAKDADEAKLRQLALASPKVVAALEGKAVKKVVVIPGRLVNIVIG